MWVPQVVWSGLKQQTKGDWKTLKADGWKIVKNNGGTFTDFTKENKNVWTRFVTAHAIAELKKGADFQFHVKWTSYLPTLAASTCTPLGIGGYFAQPYPYGWAVSFDKKLIMINSWYNGYAQETLDDIIPTLALHKVGGYNVDLHTNQQTGAAITSPIYAKFFDHVKNKKGQPQQLQPKQVRFLINLSLFGRSAATSVIESFVGFAPVAPGGGRFDFLMAIKGGVESFVNVNRAQQLEKQIDDILKKKR